MTETRAAVAALDELLRTNKLTAVDIEGRIDPQLVCDARRCAKLAKGEGVRTVSLAKRRLEELQEGLAKLQMEGVLSVLDEIKAAKTQHAEAAAVALEDLLSANGLADIKGIDKYKGKPGLRRPAGRSFQSDS
jgi:hypothetical protein